MTPMLWKLIDDLAGWGLAVSAVVITRYEEQASARILLTGCKGRV